MEKTESSNYGISLASGAAAGNFGFIDEHVNVY